MVVTLQTANIIISTISLILAYFITTTLSNFFKAWVASLMGDDTAEQCGFLTLNPLAHLDIIGLMLVPFFYFGWGRYVPVDPTNIRGSWRIPKIIFTFLSNSIACIGIAFVALILLIGIFDHHIIDITQLMLLYNTISYRIISAAYPTHHSSMIAIGTILIGTMYLSMVLSVLQAIVNSVYLSLIFTSHRIQYRNIDTIILLILLVLFVILPILGIFDVVGVLRIMVVQIITYSGHAFASLIGFL